MVLQTHYLEVGQGLEPVDAAVRNDRGPLPATFMLKDIWMFGSTKSTSELTAVAQTPLCIFFPSNASWLSPGRSTRSVACCIEPVNYLINAYI